MAKPLTVRIPNYRENYEGWQTETGSSDLSRSYGDSGTSLSCQEVYEGRQRTPVVADGCDASRENLSVRRPKGILHRLMGACFKPWKIENVDTVNCSPDVRAYPVASATFRSKGRTHTDGGTNPGSYNSIQTPWFLPDYPAKSSFRFTVDGVYKATGNFSLSYKIGQGSSGAVYKVKLNDGTYVAIKRAKKAAYDEHQNVEFQSEVQTLARIKHLNLVKFLGYLEHEDEKIIVVEYVPNGTLREHLDGLRGTILNLANRLDVAVDVAHAITYLHMYKDDPIIHGDIKSSNILLTEKFRAKVADFWSACSAETYTGATYIASLVKGTAGYLDPDYLRTYQLTEKSDIYSFGVLLVELISGRRPIEPKKQANEFVTVRWAMKNFAEGNAIQVLDPSLTRNAAANLALDKILELAQQCLSPTSQGRPTMWRCAGILWNIRKEYRYHMEYTQGVQEALSHGW
ncbi:calmodulin-binding receptor-like cytoplasmic kinase 2 [Aristolochia californica]|uniref:calmodulin-binding receptor-like cytoplasmic kinase 2 n=1 Tax=Aristolochia californica TaxID=171875 RepID=UPI0035D667EB